MDLTDLGLDGGCFASFVAETRSSPSVDSTLSDFAFGSFPLCSKPDITTHVRQGGDNISVINKGESVYDHAALTGDSGTVTGSVKFFVCRDANANPDCSTGGDQVGGSVDLANGEANSADFTPTQLGYYCFRVDYTPAQGSKYLATSHTNQTSECFQVIPAEIKLDQDRGRCVGIGRRPDRLHPHDPVQGTGVRVRRQGLGHPAHQRRPLLDDRVDDRRLGHRCRSPELRRQ